MGRIERTDFMLVFIVSMIFSGRCRPGIPAEQRGC